LRTLPQEKPPEGDYRLPARGVNSGGEKKQPPDVSGIVTAGGVTQAEHRSAEDTKNERETERRQVPGGKNGAGEYRRNELAARA
jgi:hypothetical protein